MHRLERGPAAESQRRADGDAIQRYVEIGARKPVAVDFAGYDRGASPDRFVHLLPIDLLRIGGADHARQSTKRKHVNTTHVRLLLYRAERPLIALYPQLQDHATSPAKWSPIPTAEHASRVVIIPILNRKIAMIAATESASAQASTLAGTGMSNAKPYPCTGLTSRNIVCSANQIARLRTTPT